MQASMGQAGTKVSFGANGLWSWAQLPGIPFRRNQAHGCNDMLTGLRICFARTGTTMLARHVHIT